MTPPYLPLQHTHRCAPRRKRGRSSRGIWTAYSPTGACSSCPRLGARPRDQGGASHLVTACMHDNDYGVSVETTPSPRALSPAVVRVVCWRCSPPRNTNKVHTTNRKKASSAVALPSGSRSPLCAPRAARRGGIVQSLAAAAHYRGGARDCACCTVRAERTRSFDP